LFHQRYLESFEFLTKFETKCSQFDKDVKNRLKKSNPYKYFIKKWPIQVYFQIRFQEIVFKLEEDLIDYHLLVVTNDSNNEDYDFDQNCFSLKISDTLVKQMEYCWLETKCYLKSLLSNFWKLNLQLVSRYSFFFIQMFQTKLGQLDTEISQIKETTSNNNSEDQISNENNNQPIIDDIKLAVFLLFDAYKLQTLRVNISFFEELKI